MEDKESLAVNLPKRTGLFKGWRTRKAIEKRPGFLKYIANKQMPHIPILAQMPAFQALWPEPEHRGEEAVSIRIDARWQNEPTFKTIEFGIRQQL